VLHVQKRLVILVCSAILSTSAPLFAASPTDGVADTLTQFDRTLCRTLSFAKCKRDVVKKQVKRTKANPDAAQSAKQKTGPKPAKPVPVLKPETPKVKAVMPQVQKPVVKKRPGAAPKPATPAFEATPTGSACFAALEDLGVQFMGVATTVGSGACKVVDPVQVQSMSLGKALIKFPDEPTLTCGFALTFARWVKRDANPIVRSATAEHIATMGTGPGYECRSRNGDGSGKLSEHAFGNAVDVERITLQNGDVINVKDVLASGSRFQPVLAKLRASSCAAFTTVLGPGSNVAHAEHFHLDRVRRGKTGTFRLCE
jgi:hypothetical protein